MGIHEFISLGLKGRGRSRSKPRQSTGTTGSIDSLARFIAAGSEPFEFPQEVAEQSVDYSRRVNPDALTSIVVLSYDRKEDLERCIESVYRRTDRPFELIIWDNGSHRQETIEYLKSIEGRTKQDGNGHVRVVYNDQNLGCSQGRREALKLANGDYVVTLDNDIEVATNRWLDDLVAMAESSDDIAAVGGKILLPDGTVQANGGFIRNLEGSFAEVKANDVGRSREDPTANRERECEWLPGGAMLIKASAARQVEHDSEFPIGYEDYDYSMQLRKLGYRLVTSPSAEFIHHHRAYDGRVKRDNREYVADRTDPNKLWRSMLRLYQKTGLNLVRGFAEYKTKGFNGLPTDVSLEDLDRVGRVQEYMESEIARTLPPIEDIVSEPGSNQTPSARPAPIDPLVSIVVLSYERAEDLKRCIESIQRYTHVPYELLIFDNGSGTKIVKNKKARDATPAERDNNATIRYLKSIDGQTLEDGNGHVRVVFNDKNEGCSTGRRKSIALAHASSDYLIFVDNDMEMIEDSWAQKMVKRMEDDPSLGAANAKVAYPNRKVQFTGCGFHIEDGDFIRPVYLDTDKEMTDLSIEKEVYTPVVNGGSTIFRKEVFRNGVMHDDAYPNGFEDWDVAFQMLEKGYRMGNVDLWMVHHHISHSGRKNDEEEVYRHDRHGVESRLVSMLAFMERTGFNYIKPTNWYGWGSNEKKKRLLEVLGHTDLTPGRALPDLTNEELKAQFEHVLKERAQRGIAAEGRIDVQKALEHCIYSGDNPFYVRLGGNEIRNLAKSERFLKRLRKAFVDYRSGHMTSAITKAMSETLGEADTEKVYAHIEEAILRHKPVKNQALAKSLAGEIARNVYLEITEENGPFHSNVPDVPVDGPSVYNPPAQLEKFLAGYVSRKTGNFAGAFEGYDPAKPGEKAGALAASIRSAVNTARDESSLITGLLDCVRSHSVIKDNTIAEGLAQDLTAKIYSDMLKGGN